MSTKETSTNIKQGKNMNTLTITQLVQILMNFVGTTIVRIHAITPQNGEFHSGINGSTKTIDKMITNLNVNYTDIMKEQWASFLLTSCDYAQLVKNILAGNISKEMEELVVELTAQDKKDIINGLKDYEVSERRNGTTINPYFAVSSKDGMPMITVYRNIKGNQTVRFIYNGEIIDKNDTSSRFAPYFKKKEYKPCKKHTEYADSHGADLKKFLVTNNFRLDRIKHIKLNGTEYEIIAD